MLLMLGSMSLLGKLKHKIFHLARLVATIYDLIVTTKLDIQSSERSLGPSLNITRQLTALSLPPFEGLHSILARVSGYSRDLIVGRQHSGIDVGSELITCC